jgi:hypothetical protein
LDINCIFFWSCSNSPQRGQYPLRRQWNFSDCRTERRQCVIDRIAHRGGTWPTSMSDLSAEKADLNVDADQTSSLFIERLFRSIDSPVLPPRHGVRHDRLVAGRKQSRVAPASSCPCAANAVRRSRLDPAARIPGAAPKPATDREATMAINKPDMKEKK